MTTQQKHNITAIRRTLGTGPVREREPVPVVKKGRKVGEREAAMRAWREEQA